MGIRAQGNPIASFADLWSQTGTGAEAIIPSGPDGGHTATGGVISDWIDPSPGKVYRTHIFTSSGTFTVSELSGTYPADVEYLVVAGGGGGGGAQGQSGGGGAGGFRTNLSGHPVAAAAYPVSATSYTVTVGAGGVGGPQTGSEYGGAGGNSELYPTPQAYPHASRVRAVGGGGGAGYSATPDPVMNGGSGGGAICSPAPRDAGTGGASNPNAVDPNHPQVQGYDGGTGTPSYTSPFAGGGGGGAGRLGGPDDPTTPLGRSTGGYGLQALIAGPAGNIGAPGPDPANNYFAGGGGGGRYDGTSAAGGYGGGGDGAPPSPSMGNPGTVSTGGGGGGGGHPYLEGGHGGSGIVAIKYQIGTTAPGAKATGGSISKYDGKFIHTFTSSGTFATGPTWTSATVEYVVVAGGGGGNCNDVGGGGGAGGYLTGTTPIGAHPVSTTIQIGAGGIASYATNTQGYSGTDSFFGPPITALGGGGGAAGPGGSTGANGGSGGGGGYQPPYAGGTTPDPTQGNPGGAGVTPGASGGGGGGAGGAGTTATPNQGGHGGIGVQLPATFRDPISTVGAPGSSGTYWVAGGGGGSNDSGNAGGKGGGAGGPWAGGGNGGHYPGYDGSAGLMNTGGGGGATDDGDDATPQISGDGGSGIVLVAYPE